MKRLFLLCLLIFTNYNSNVFASSIKDDSNWLWNYFGDISGVEKVAITLVFQMDDGIIGVFYKYGEFVDLAINGKFTDKKSVSISIQDNNGQVIADLQGIFVEEDPRGTYGKNTKLEFDVLVGTYTERASKKSMPIYLRISSGTFGTIDHRYRIAGADDDTHINKNALQIWRAIQSNNARELAQLVQYPIKIYLLRKEITITNEKDFVANYNDIVTTNLRDKVVNSFPHNMFVRYDGIMMGNGEIWLNSLGKIISIQGQ